MRYRTSYDVEKSPRKRSFHQQKGDTIMYINIIHTYTYIYIYVQYNYTSGLSENMATPNPTYFLIDRGSHQNCDYMGPIPYLQTQPSTYHHKDGGSYLTVDHTRRPGVCGCKKYSAVNNAKHILKPSLLRINVAHKHPKNTRAHSAPFCSQNGGLRNLFTQQVMLLIFLLQ